MKQADSEVILKWTKLMNSDVSGVLRFLFKRNMSVLFCYSSCIIYFIGSPKAFLQRHSECGLKCNDRWKRRALIILILSTIDEGQGSLAVTESGSWKDIIAQRS
jgi:hypothetical protein